MNADNRYAITPMKRVATVLCLLTVMALLSGCLYPQDRKVQNQVSTKEAVRLVQGAIDQYFEDKSMLPIKNALSETPIYEKFLIDFQKLQRSGYLSSIPTAAFENGGNYYFIIIDEENSRQVKLLDIVTTQRINDIQSWVKEYTQSNVGKLPLGNELYEGFYMIDYKAMNKKEPEIRSVFSGQTLQAMVDQNGVVYTDYGLDLMQLIQQGDAANIKPEQDIRELLTDSSDMVPVKSPVYHWLNNEPQAVIP